MEAEVESARTALIKRVLRQCLEPGNLPTSEHLELWRSLEWASIHVIQNAHIIRCEFDVDLPIAQLYEVKEDLPKLVELIRLIRSGGSIEEISIDWAQECLLPATSSWPTAAPDAVPRGSYALLTGATGFLGAALLRELLERYPKMKLKCLVRTRDSSSADKRLMCALQQRGQWTEMVATAASDGRLQAVEAQLGEERFGLDAHAFENLACSVQTVFHCGSWVDHIAGYKTLEPVNVGSVMQIIQMAQVRGQQKPLRVHYVSTISVIQKGLPEYTLTEPRQLQARGGYVQSKWVAECRLRQAAAQGLCCVCSIVRPGMLTPDTRSGAANMADWIIRFLTGSIMAGGYLVDGVDPVMHLTPVNHAAAATVLFAEISGAAHVPCPFHIPTTVQIKTRQLLAMVAGSSELCGRRVRALESEAWRVVMDQLPCTNPLYPFRDRFVRGLGGLEGGCAEESVAALEQHCAADGLPWAHSRGYTKEQVDLIVRYIVINSDISDTVLMSRTRSITGHAECQWFSRTQSSESTHNLR